MEEREKPQDDCLDAEWIVISVSFKGEDGEYYNDEISFWGRWIVEQTNGYDVALTEQGQLLTYFETDGLPLYKIYKTPDELAEDQKIPDDVKSAVAEALKPALDEA